MKANEKAFLRFMEGADKQFIIPVYQRNYDWNKEQCGQFFNDIIDISTDNQRTHFLGSIVSIYYDDGKGQEYLIIDGQQRITTLSLLLLAIYELLEKGELQSKIIKQQIKEEYLVNKYSLDDKKLRLKPIKADSEAFYKLFGKEESYIVDSNITNNFFYFKEQLRKMQVSIDDFFNALKRLMIVEIELKRGEDDPQLIFESLNSTGLSLTQADLVRNFILMKENSKKQEFLYDEYWSIIEKNTKFKVSDFIRDYLTLKERVTPNKDKVYLSFKKYVSKNFQEAPIEDLLKDIIKFSKYYNKIAYCNETSKNINELLKKLNNLEITVCYPFLLEIFEKYESGFLSEDDILDILKIIESFVFRRLICDVPTNALNKLFMVLGREIEKLFTNDSKYVDVIKFLLLSKRGNQRFPNNQEFIDKLKLRDVYNLKSKNKWHLLESLENFENKEKVNVEELLRIGEINIEHIMPQTLSSKWKSDLGENYLEIHEKYLNTIGNITLTGYNSKMSNKNFVEKRNMEKGFKDSRLFLNSSLNKIERWGETEIKIRADILCEKAIKIWEIPITSFTPKKDTSNIYSLVDDHEFTGEKIESFTFIDQEYKVDNWKDFYQRLVHILYERDPNIFKSLLIDRDFYTKKRKLISKNEKDLRKALKVSETLFLESHYNTEAVLDMIRLLLKKYCLDEDELSISLRKNYINKTL